MRRLWMRRPWIVLGSLATALGCRAPAVGDTTNVDAGSDTSATDATETNDGDPGETGETGETVPLGRPAGVFGGGPLYNDAATVLPRLKDSGFDTVIFWSVHIHDDGDLVLNDQLIVEDGAYVGDPAWPGLVVDLEAPPTTVVRTEFSTGAWGVPDFDNIAALIDSEGTGPDSILYRNFAALKAAIPTIDAINYDDETFYEANPTIAFSLMLSELGYRVTFAPYEQMQFWVTVYDYLESVQPGLVDRVLLQVYAGGAFNQPAQWSEAFAGLEVEPGLWSLHGQDCSAGLTPAQVQTRMETWSDTTVGGWMWLLDDLLACEAEYPLEDYAAAIHTAYPD